MVLHTDISMITFLSISVLAVIGYEKNRIHADSLATVSEQGVNLPEYAFCKKYEGCAAGRAVNFQNGRQPAQDRRSNGLLSMVCRFVQAAYPKKNYSIHNSEVMCSTTIGAYANLIAGNVDIIFCLRPSKQQLERAKSKGVELKLTPIGREAFVFFVNAQNEVSQFKYASWR